MIRLFKKDEINFDSNGLGVLDPAIKENVVEEKMNGIYNFDFAYLSSGKHAGQLEGDMVIKAPTPDGDQLFRVYKVTKNIGYLEVNCYHIFYDLAGNFIEDTNIVSQSGQAAITHFGTGLQYATRFKFVSNIVRTNSARMVRLNAVQALLDSSQDNSFLSRWGGEIKRDNFTVFMNDIRGNDKGFKIRHGKNLTGYEANIDHSTVVTRIMPYGYNGLMLPEKYVDSPLRDKYAFTRIKKIEYTNIKAIDPDATSNDEDAVPLEEAYELLRQAAALEYSVNKVDIPTSNFKVTFKNLADTKEYADFKALEKVDPWDYVTVTADNLDITSRMISYKYDAITKAYKEVELGNYVPSFSDTNAETNNKLSNINNDLNNINNDLNTVAESANGKNSNYYGSAEPSHPVDGDLWYKKNGDKTELWQYDGKSVPPGWKLVVDDATGEEVKQSVDEALKGTQEAIDSANDAVAKANDAVNQAGFANDNANQAKTDAATALQNALDAFKHADEIKNGLQLDIDTINGQLSLKANQIDVDKLGGRVTNAEAQIKLQADQIALTVSKTELTNILGDYATQTWTQSQIKATADQINLSVTKVNSKVDNLNTSDRNLLMKSGTLTGGLHSDQGGNVISGNYNGNAIAKFELVPANKNFQDPYQIDTTITPNQTEYALSFFAKADNAGDGFVCYFYNPSNTTGATSNQGRHSEGTGTDGNVAFQLTSSWQRYWVKWTQRADATTTKRIIIGRTGTALGANVPGRSNKGATYMSSPMLVEGNMPNKAWSGAPEDYTTEVEFSQLQITVNGIQGTVANKADQSQVTQLADQITSVVGSISNPNLLPNSGHPKDLSYWSSNIANGLVMSGGHGFYENGKTTLFKIDNRTAGTEVTANTIRVPVKPGKKYTVSGIFFASSNVTGTDIWFLSRPIGSTENYTEATLIASNVKYSPNSAEYKQYTFTTKADANEGYIRIDNNGSSTAPNPSSIFFAELKLELGDHATPWVFDDSQSQITQLANDINLRVQKGDVIGQINIEAGKTLIQNNNLILDAKTVTFTGSAFIPNAAITSINADKITAGTLNAANVNVINLNANNITTGTIKGANLAINLNTGEVTFQKGRIHSTSNNIDINIDQGYVSVANGNARVMMKNGGIQFVQPNIFDDSTNPYLSISNGGSGLAFTGARIVGRDYIVIANSANSNNIFDQTMGGAETFAGVSVGFDGSTWHPTKIGGAERGIILSAGKSLSTNVSFVGSPASIRIGSDGSSHWNGNRIELTGEYVHSLSTYTKTASGSANVIVAPDGALVRSTSASKYKTDIVRTNISNYGEKLLELPTATWTDIAETKRYRDDPANQIKPTRNFGMIAEDLAEAGLEMLVVRGIDGELEGINYDRIGPALIPVIAKLKNEVEILKQKLEEKTA